MCHSEFIGGLQTCIDPCYINEDSGSADFGKMTVVGPCRPDKQFCLNHICKDRLPIDDSCTNKFECRSNICSLRSFETVHFVSTLCSACTTDSDCDEGMLCEDSHCYTPAIKYN